MQSVVRTRIASVPQKLQEFLSFETFSCSTQESQGNAGFKHLRPKAMVLSTFLHSLTMQRSLSC